MKICKNCSGEIVVTNIKTNNIVFCKKECRLDFYRKNPSPSHTKEAMDKRNHEKYNKKGEGKFPCPYCTGWYFALLRHVAQRHEMTEREFKEAFKLKKSCSFIQETEREIKRNSIEEHKIIALLLKNGMATRIKKGEKLAPSKRNTKVDYRG